MHLRVEDVRVNDDNDAFCTNFQYKVEQGSAVFDHYGLELAKLAFLPPEVMLRAREVAVRLSELVREGRDSTASHALVKRRKILFELRDKLAYLIKHSLADNESLAKHLKNMQDEMYEELRTTLHM
ncbi:uncharacterized protein I303_104716 [Kwoniella dejecticola CBS 10117]